MYSRFSIDKVVQYYVDSSYMLLVATYVRESIYSPRRSLRLVSRSKHKARWHSHFTLHGDTSLLFSVLVRSEIGFNAGLSDVAAGSPSTAVSWTGTSWHPRPSKQERIQAAVHSTSALQ